MASPEDKKGQRKGSCGHIMAAFDSHDKCARCRDKRIGEDNCVLDKPCPICDNFSESQKELLATPSYRIRKEKEAGILVSPKDVTVISTNHVKMNQVINLVININRTLTNLTKDVTGLSHRLLRNLWFRRKSLLHRLIPAPVRRLLINPVLFKLFLTKSPPVKIIFLPVLLKLLGPCILLLELSQPVPSLSHRSRKSFLSKCRMLILTSQTPCPVQMKDSYLIPLKLQNKLKICHTERQSAQFGLLWVGIIFQLLSQTFLSPINQTTRRKENSPENLQEFLSPCHQMTGFARS